MAYNKRVNNFQKMRKNGLNSVAAAQMYGIAHKEVKKMEHEVTERAFLYMLAIPLNVLVGDGLIDKTNAESYLNDVISLYKSVEAKIVSERQLADLLEEYAGMRVEASWLERKEADNG